MNRCVKETNVAIDFRAVFKGVNVGGIDRQGSSQFSCSKSITHFWAQSITLGTLPDSSLVHLICVTTACPHTRSMIRHNIVMWAALDTGGPKVVLSMWVGYQLMQVGVIAHEARAGVLTHPVILEVPTGQTVSGPWSSAARSTMLITTVTG